MSRAPAQIAVDEALHFRGGFLARRGKGGAGGGARNPIDAGLHLLDIGTQCSDLGLGPILPRDDVEAGFRGVGGGRVFGSGCLEIHMQSFRWGGEIRD